MAAYDNVSLPGAPNIATAGNYAQLLMQGLSNIPEAYYKGQEQRYQQQQRNLFQDPDNQALLDDAIKTGKYGPLLQKMIQSGGAPAAANAIPILQKQPFLDAALQEMRSNGGGGPWWNGGNAAAQSSSAAGPANVGGGQASASAQPQLSATGSDSAGAETVRSLTAGIANGRNVPDPVIGNYARALGVEPDTPLSAGQEARARQIIGNNLRAGGQPQAAPAAGPVPAAAPPGAMAVAQPQAPQAAPQGAPAAPGGATGAPAWLPGGEVSGRFTGDPAGGLVPPGFKGDSRDFAAAARIRAEALRRQAGTAGIVGIPSKPKEDQAAALDKQADAIDAAWKQEGERTPEQKNVASGTEERKGQIAADTKYYDSLHRGLAGSGMIAAQQKQNIDVLRQIAASPSFTPGAGSGLAVGYQRILAQLGINPRGAAPREVFNQLAARVLADQFSGIKSLASETGEQGARIFKPMLDIEDRANITHEDSLEGVKSKLNLLDRTGDLMMKWADMADDYKIKHGKLDAGFDKELRGEIGKARVSNAMAPAMPRFDTREEAALWARREGIRPGEPVRLPSGKVINAP